ncbi:anthrone oxygenase family protein [Streptomyces sp. NPDC056600]|uniref:anthrone oxygenase family protein n=1 Tax=Streptomyces sp. NPDC056600 TaxID=3345874 RepID=UPI0036A2893D
MFNALEIVTTVIVGVMVGVEFCVAVFVNPILDALPGDGAQRGRSHGARLLGAVMPFWYLSSLVLVVVWWAAGRGEDGARLVAAGGGLLLVSVLMSVLLLVPINNRSKEWTVGDRPADWKQQTRRWDRLHLVRVAVIVGAFALLVTALA